MWIGNESDRLAYRLKVAVMSTGMSRRAFARACGIDSRVINAVMRRSPVPGTTNISTVRLILRTAERIREEEYRGGTSGQ